MSHRIAITTSFVTATCFCLFAMLTAFSCITSEQVCEGNWVASEGIPEEWTPNLDIAQIEVIRWSRAGEDGPLIAWVSEWTCCDCGLVHRMAYVPLEEGLAIYIWRLERETMVERMRRGTYRDIYRNMFAAENELIKQ